VAWYLPFRGGLTIKRLGNTTHIKVIAALYNKPWPASKLPSYIDTIYVVFGNSCDIKQVYINSPVYAAKVAGLSADYADDLLSLDVSFIVVDRGLIEGNLTSPLAVDRVLNSTGLHVALRNRYLTVYRLSKR
jgi:hypothetical protein